MATLTERVVTDMFWASYRIHPEPSVGCIYDDALWDQCRFTFRDVRTRHMCTSAFVGGKAPFVRDGRVSLRALHFGPRVP